jgi:hypothetical protein
MYATTLSYYTWSCHTSFECCQRWPHRHSSDRCLCGTYWCPISTQSEKVTYEPQSLSARQKARLAHSLAGVDECCGLERGIRGRLASWNVAEFPGVRCDDWRIGALTRLPQLAGPTSLLRLSDLTPCNKFVECCRKRHESRKRQTGFRPVPAL